MALRASSIVCIWSSAAAAEPAAAPSSAAYTNVAGRVICAVPESLSNGVVRLSGRSYPLSIFPASEQVRLRLALGVPVLPSELVSRRDLYRDLLVRIAALEGAGEQDAGKGAAHRAAIFAAWKRALEACPALSPAERDYWSTRL